MFLLKFLNSEEISFLISSLELEKLLLILSRLLISSDNFETSSELSLLDDDTLWFELAL